MEWKDSVWTEFAGTFVEDERRTGIDVKVFCRCGRIAGVVWRYDGGCDPGRPVEITGRSVCMCEVAVYTKWFVEMGLAGVVGCREGNVRFAPFAY